MAGHERTDVPRQSRTMGYHNLLHDQGTSGGDWIELPPSYERACSARRAPLRVTQHVPPGSEQLPHYTCSIEESAVSHVKYERNNPFESLDDSSWSEVFLVLQGTRLAFHQIQTPNLFSKTKTTLSAGRLVKTYTLQHAEVGIASDHKKYELVARSPMTSLLPEVMQNRMKQSEPHLFESIRMYVIRLRVECDQILLRFRTWDERARWIDRLCAAIDISPALDERSEPSKHTLPRRRRHRHGRATPEAARQHLASLVQQQERIIRERFPHLLPVEEADEQDPEGRDLNEDPEADDLDTGVVTAESDPQSPGGNNDDDDDNVFSREDAVPHLRPNVRAGDASPSPIRHVQQCVSSLSILRSPNAFFQPTITEIPTYTKLGPTPQLDPPGEARYRRRCMPSLLHGSRRGNNDIVIHAGSRWRIDWNAKLLRPWPEPAPKYTADETLPPGMPEGTFSFASAAGGAGAGDPLSVNGGGGGHRDKAGLRKVKSSAEIAKVPGREVNLGLVGGRKHVAVINNRADGAGAGANGSTTAESSSAESSLNAPEENGHKTRTLLKDMGRKFRFGKRRESVDDVAAARAAKEREAQGVGAPWTQSLDAS